ncbi:hypothetical protein CROQUDRAFT_654743 [Cronartium quercuum f. sp. fusiforme G11]|uniref:C2H2-type domain-containing protein n=1 Tax=Cronartium quercuum f. sp. fusiforme G11 TaxID=708437 RepID=A0A9P6NQI4_9BASI|nr:hypothetical protein CROQUDRAFT_654743 [Cronartium quercuum f. sp. fusiforme G11]
MCGKWDDRRNNLGDDPPQSTTQAVFDLQATSFTSINSAASHPLYWNPPSVAPEYYLSRHEHDPVFESLGPGSSQNTTTSHIPSHDTTYDLGNASYNLSTPPAVPHDYHVGHSPLNPGAASAYTSPSNNMSEQPPHTLNPFRNSGVGHIVQNTNSTSRYDISSVAGSRPIQWGQDNQPASQARAADLGDAFRRGPKIYVCPFCSKMFDRPSTLATHQLTHTGEKPHTCSKCGKSFSVASNLRRHEQSIHAPKPKSELAEAPPGMGPPRHGIVGSTSSSILYQRGYEVYENLLPSTNRPLSMGTTPHNTRTNATNNQKEPSHH